jgi:hypothetical protein
MLEELKSKQEHWGKSEITHGRKIPPFLRLEGQREDVGIADAQKLRPMQGDDVIIAWDTLEAERGGDFSFLSVPPLIFC